MSKLAVGVIGLGVGEQHAQAYHSHPDCELAAICDTDPDRLREVAVRFPGTRETTSAEGILDDPSIDVVSVASWDDAHYRHVSHALRNGKHVFVEKPLCQTEQEAREIQALLLEHPQLRLSSNLPLRASPRFREIKEQIGAGELGRIYYVEASYDYGRLYKLTDGWRGELEEYSVFLGGGIHLVDLILWMTGDAVVRVTAAGNRITTEGTNFRFDDLVVALLEFESGLIAKVSANFGCVHPHFHGLTVFGTEGTFVNGLEQGSLWRRTEDGLTRSTVEGEYPGAGKGDLIPSFIGAILGGGEPTVSAEEIFATMSVCFAVGRSHASGEPRAVESLG